MTANATPKSVSCADLDRMWGQENWQAALDVLTQLASEGQTCGIEALGSKRYAAHLNFGGQLEEDAQSELAIAQYRAALALDGQRQEALRALTRLNGLPPPTRASCKPYTAALYNPNDGGPFAKVRDGRIVLGETPFYMRGVNYYPRNAPWQGFIAGSDLDEVQEELDLIAGRGFNTLRIFLWYDALFQCQPERAVPTAGAFEKLDTFIEMARARGLRLIVTLNDLPDFYFRPIYRDRARYEAQTEFVVKRYRDEPAILMWDVRNEGDIDYGVTGKGMPNSTRADVLAWLAHVTASVRANDSNHLVTAGWLRDTMATEPYVDVLSYHHWSSEEGIAEHIARVRAQTTKPILLEEMGLTSAGADGETEQAERLKEMVRVVEANETVGWLIWTAFDFFALPDDLASPEHRFGIWRNNLDPKPALDRLPLPTRVP